MASLDYQPFEVDIGSRGPGFYEIKVNRAPGGDAGEPVIVDSAALTEPLVQLEEALTSHLDQPHLYTDGPGDWDEFSTRIRELSKQLLKVLLPQRLGEALVKSLVSANQTGLRISLSVPPELDTMPWELLWDPNRQEFAVLSKQTTIVRYPASRAVVKPMAVSGPLRILVFASQPIGLPRLNVDDEARNILTAFKGLSKQKAMPTVASGSTWEALTEALKKADYHVFHFIGHGGQHPETHESAIALCTSDRRPHYVSGRELARPLGDHPSLRLVVLNSCEGARGDSQKHLASAASSLSRVAIPAVLAMRYAITDEAAIQFARTFYRSLATFSAVDEAVNEARQAISVMSVGTMEWATPALFLRGTDGKLFEQRAAKIQQAKSPLTSKENLGSTRRNLKSTVTLRESILRARLDRVGKIAGSMRGYVTKYEEAYLAKEQWGEFLEALTGVEKIVSGQEWALTELWISLAVRSFAEAHSKYGGDIVAWLSGVDPPCEDLVPHVLTYRDKLDLLKDAMDRIDQLVQEGSREELIHLPHSATKEARNVYIQCQEICKVLLERVLDFVLDLQSESNTSLEP